MIRRLLVCCDSLPGTEGFAFGILALLLAGGPLALPHACWNGGATTSG